MMLFGTGGGATIPPSVAGEVTPLELRVVAGGIIAKIGSQPVAVEWAGAAPGLLSGITQINIKLPDVIPATDGFPRGVVPLYVGIEVASFSPWNVTVSVSPD
jgi:uncharacterized protein (TIGR03437 family)